MDLSRKVFDDVTQLIGSRENPTPLVRLKRISPPGGGEIFAKNCAMCHQAEGQGLEGVFPPVAKSDYLMGLAKGADRSDLVGLILNGKVGKLTVNGKEYNGVMTPVAGLSDDDIAAVLTFITTNWGNSGAKPFTIDEVKKARAAVSAKTP